MIKTDFTYHEIVEYIWKNGVEISILSVQRYAANLNTTLESLRLAQENFRAVMEETEKYKNLDVTNGILRLLSNQIFQAVNNFSDENLNEIYFETLTKNRNFTSVSRNLLRRNSHENVRFTGTLRL